MGAFKHLGNPMVLSVAMRFAGSILVFASGILLARWLQPAGYGLYTTMLALATIAATPLSAGLPTLLTRETANALAVGAYDRVRGLLRFSATAILITVLAIGLIFAGLAYVGVLSNLPRVALPFIVLVALFTGIELMRGAIMRGLGSALLSQLPEVIVRPALLLGVLAIAICLAPRDALGAALLAYVAAVAGALVVGGVLLRRAMREIPRPAPAKGEYLPWLRALPPLSLLSASQTWVGTADPILLSWLGTFADVGVYKVALQGVALMLVVQTGVGTVVITELSRHFAMHSATLIVKTSDRSLLFSASASLIAWGAFMAFAEPVISAVFGGEYTGAAPVLQVLATGQLVNALTGPSLTILIMARMERLGLLSIGLGAAVTFAGAIALVGSLGPVGMAYASAAGVIAANLTLAAVVATKVGFDPTIFGAFRRLRHA